MVQILRAKKNLWKVMKLMFRLSNAILTHFGSFAPEKCLSKQSYFFVSRSTTVLSGANDPNTFFLLLYKIYKKSIPVFVTYHKIVMVLRWIPAKIWAVELDQVWGGCTQNVLVQWRRSGNILSCFQQFLDALASLVIHIPLRWRRATWGLAHVWAHFDLVFRH